MSKSGETATFTYNADGLRVKKVCTTTGTTNYTLHGKNLVHLSNGSNNLHFFYDAQNRPAVVVFNGTAYGYVHNLQGDIIAIVNSSGTKVVEYTYDPWGKPLTKAGTLASTLGTLNPFRYRGYVYDEETGFYNLRSRYYAPIVCRFQNVDTLLLLYTNYSANLHAYAYCDNMCINCADSEGMEKSAFHNEMIYVWNITTHEEKILIALLPNKAMTVRACQQDADNMVEKYYGSMEDGDEANAFRHAVWNALMKVRFGSDSSASLWATAHESHPEELLKETDPWNGYDAFQHREMDLHNNEMGRNSVEWYEFWLTPDEIAQRVIKKLNNGEGLVLVE